MKLLHTLSVPIENKVVDIRFGILDTKEEIEATKKLRYKIYNKYGYLDSEQYGDETESDVYDDSGEVTYFAGFIGERPIAFIRAIQSETLPIENFFIFDKPERLVPISQEKEVVELGRLVIDRYEEGNHFPRNTVLLFLIYSVVEYYRNTSVQFGYSFLKKRLMGKLNKLHVPYTEISPFKLNYPPNGPMAPYFYNEEDPATPAYFALDEVTSFIHGIIKNEKLFQKKSSNHFLLQTNLYTRFLRTLGVV